ncbi:MAG TPA: hypothetical protein VE175_13075, partial [Woeseiaceae bacterium]|nr:hypothetical protein [Woeseiaceae bacterium]
MRSILPAIAVAAALAGCNPAPESTDRTAGQNPSPADGGTAAQPSAAAAAVFDTSDLDPGIDPCTNFNAFVNERWIEANPIPADRTRWGAFDELREKSLNDQRTIVEKAAHNVDTAEPGSIERKIGVLYATGMDQAAIDAAGFDPIKSKLAEIAALEKPSDVATWLTKTFTRGDQQIFAFGSGADFKNAAT